jgi:hypothetical protein
MSKEIKINFNYTKELALKASKLFYDYDMKNSSKRYVGWLFIAMMQFGVVGALKHNSFGILFISTFLVIYWYYVRWYVRKGLILKYYNKSGLNGRDVTFVLRDNELYFDDQKIEDIKEVIKLEDGILLQTLTNTLFFDRDSFSKYEDMNEFFLTLKQKKDKA